MSGPLYERKRIDKRIRHAQRSCDSSRRDHVRVAVRELDTTTNCALSLLQSRIDMKCDRRDTRVFSPIKLATSEKKKENNFSFFITN